jgi:hypothetical protein
MVRRLLTLSTATFVALLTALGLAGPAAAVTTEQKLAVLSSWTQTSAASYNTWNTARTNQDDWVSYGFDWSTDYCSSSPDNPLGFDFRLSCHRHDFGYRNYKRMNLFPANKPRLDSAFYEDMRRRCGAYSAALRPACYSLAWTYYQAVRVFGSLRVSQADLDRAEALLPTG